MTAECHISTWLSQNKDRYRKIVEDRLEMQKSNNEQLFWKLTECLFCNPTSNYATFQYLTWSFLRCILCSVPNWTYFFILYSNGSFFKRCSAYVFSLFWQECNLFNKIWKPDMVYSNSVNLWFYPSDGTLRTVDTAICAHFCADILFLKLCIICFFW